MAAQQHAQHAAERARARAEAEQLAAQARQEAAQAAARAERWEIEARSQEAAAAAAVEECAKIRSALKSFERAFIAEHGRKPVRQDRHMFSQSVKDAYVRRKELYAKYPGLQDKRVDPPAAGQGAPGAQDVSESSSVWV